MANGQVQAFPKSQVTVKTVATVCLSAAVVLGALYVLVRARLALTLIVGAALLAVALYHPVHWLVRRHIRKGLAVTAVMCASLALASGLVLLVVPPAVIQGKALVQQAPELLSKVRSTKSYQLLDARLELDQRLSDLQSQLPARLDSALDAAVRAVSEVLTAFAATVTLLFLVVFMLLFGDELVKQLLDEATSERRSRYQRVLGKIYHSIGGYLAGLSFVCLVNGVCTSIVLAVLKMPFFIPLGIVSGLSSLVPLAGNTVAGIAVTCIVLAAKGLWAGVAAGVYFILYQQFENHVLGPVVYRRTANINPLVSIAALLVFAELWGIPGALVAVPAVAAGQIVVREVLQMRREALNAPRDGRVSDSV